MHRFGRQNLIRPVSLTQFQDTAFELIDALDTVRDDLEVIMSLTTNGDYYHGIGSLTILTDEVREESMKPENQPKKLHLGEVTTEEFENAYSRDFTIVSKDETPYMVCLSNEVRHDRRMLFYGQALDAQSEELFMEFNKKDRLLQILDNGFPQTSAYSAMNASVSLGIKSPKSIFGSLLGLD